MKFPDTPELGSSIVNEAGWKVVEALPECPPIVFNHLKPAFYAGLQVVLEHLRKKHAVGPQAVPNPSFDQALAELSFAMGSPCGRGTVGDLATPLIKLAAERLREHAAALTQATSSEGEPVGRLTISKFRGHLENRDFEYFGDLPEGTYQLYTAQPAPAARPMPDKPLAVFSHGPWTFTETGESFTGAQLDAEAFVKYRARIGSQPTAPAVPAEVLLQGGLSNDQLREAFAEKLPGIEPSDRTLTIFALGVEVGAHELAEERRMSRMYFDERNSARDAWRRAADQREEARALLSAAPAVVPAVPDMRKALEDLEDAAEQWASYVEVDTAPCPLVRYLEPYFENIRTLLASAPTSTKGGV